MVGPRSCLVLLASVVLAVALAPAALAAVVGDQTVEPQQAKIDATSVAYAVTASTTTTVDRLVVYLDAAGKTFAAGVYADNGGHPGTLLAQGTPCALPVDASWNAVSMPPTVLTAGSRYWIAFADPPSGRALKLRVAAAGGSAEDGPPNLDLPATWTGGSARNDGPLSAYLIGSSPILQVSPAALSFSAAAGSAAPAPQQLTVANGGDGLLDWSATTDAPWLSVVPQSGVGPGATAVGVSTAGLAPGTYAGTVDVWAAGAQASPAAVPVTLTITDATAPTVALTLPADGAAVAGTVMVSADAADDVGVAGVQFRLDGADLGAEDTSAPYSVAWSTAAVADGAYTLTAIARDVDGNAATSAAVRVQVDNTAPTVSITAPAGHVAATAADPFPVTAASPDADVARVELSACSDNSVGCATGSWTSLGVDTTAPYSAPWPLPGDGSRALRAVATDGAGNTGSTVVDVLVDRTLPTGTLSAPTGVAVLSGTAVLAADAADNGGLADVRFELSPSGAASWTTIGTSTTAPYTAALATATLADGAYDIRAVVTDLAGNSAATAAVRALVDNGAPTVALADPGAAVRGVVALTASAGDGTGSGVARVSFERAASAPGPWTPIATDADAPYAADLDTRTLADGAYLLRATATDAAGHSASSAAASVRVDNTAPAVSITAPRGPVNATAANPLTVTAASPDADVAQVELFRCSDASMGCATGSWISLGVDAAAPYNALWALPADGNRALRAVATDGAGNTGAAVVDVALDRTLPTGALTSPVAGALLGGTVTLTADAADLGSGIAAVRFERSPAGAGSWTAIAAATAAPYSTTLSTPALPDGPYDLRVVVTDLAGNTTTAPAIRVAVDNAAPTVSITAPQGAVNAASPNPFTVAADSPAADVARVAFFACSDTSAGCATGTWSALGTDTTVPYTALWTLPADGNRALRAVATDTAGNAGAAAVDVSVDRTLPSGAITAPTQGTTVSATTTVTARASDNVRVAGVQFLLDGTALGVEDTTAPYSAAWNTAAAAVGTHTLGARIRDAAGNLADAAGVTVTVATAGGIDTTNAFKKVVVGPGFVDATARQVVRTASDRVYVIAADDDPVLQNTGPGVVRAYKGNTTPIPTAFAEVDAANHPKAGSSIPSKIAGVDLRMDSSGIVHTVFVDNSFPITLQYRTFDTNTDRWGVQEQLASNLPTQARGRMKYALVLDNQDKPHVVYTSGTSVLYTNRVNGTWSAPVTIATTPNPLHPSLAMDAGGTMHLAWLDEGTNPPKILYKQRAADGSWGATETVASTDVLTNANADQGPSLVVTPSGRVAVLYVSALPVSAVRVKIRSTAGTWAFDPTPTDLFTHTPQIYSRGEDIYAFLGHDVNINYAYAYHLAGQPWSPLTKLTNVADDGSATVRWDPRRETNPNIIDTANFNEDILGNRSFVGQVYYYAVVPQGAATAPPPPPADTTAPSVTVTVPAAGATVSGATAVTASATDNVGVAGVQFRLDGANLGAEDTTAPYSVSWDTTTAADGTHTLTAVARDAAGNLGNAAAVTTTVSNAAAPPPTGLVAAYSFDAGQGLILPDSSGLANVGTLNGPTWSTAGHAGGALSFDGVNDMVSVPDASSLDLTNGMTLEAWVEPSALGTAWRTILMKEAGAQLAYALYANSNTSRPVGDVYSNGFFDARGSAQLPLGSWSHVAGTFDGTTLTLYVNGDVVATRLVGGSMLPSTGALQIGGNTIIGEYFAGLVDDVRIYNRALTAKEIQTDMSRAITP